MNGIKKDGDSWLDTQFRETTTKGSVNAKELRNLVPSPQPQGKGQPVSRGSPNIGKPNILSSGTDSEFSKPVTPNKTVKIPTGPTTNLAASNYKAYIQKLAPDARSYGDDFENYDEDFEDFEPSVAQSKVEPPKIVSDVQRALHVENERASVKNRSASPPASIKARQSKEEDQELDRPPSSHVNVSNTAYVTKKIMRRFKDLKELISFDVAIFDIFEMAPLNEYEQYIRDFGASNTAQASTQWNEDSTTLEIQTDDWCVEDKWTQAPQEELKDCGSGRPDLPGLLAEQSAWDKTEKKNAILHQRKMNSTTLDSIGLLRFIRQVGQVVDVLLEENTLGQAGYCEVNDSSNNRISHGMLNLTLPNVLGKRTVNSIRYSDSDYRSLVAVWGLPDEKTKKLDHKGIITIYRITDSTSPQHVLLCDSDVSFCTLIPEAPHLVIAGTVDGGISVWDLRDPEVLPVFPELDMWGLIYRLPSYSVDGVFGIDQIHCSQIITIFHFPNNEHLNADPSNSFNENNSFQIASLDANGHAQFWTLHEISEIESEKYFETDYGLSAGSKVRLVRGGGFDLDPSPDESKCIGVKASQLHPLTGDKFIIGTDTGTLLHESRFRNTCFPREYRASPSSSTLSTRSVDSVSSIHFNPHNNLVFLVSFESGTVALFYSNQESPLVTWKISVNARYVLWSTHRPSVFYVLDSKSVLHVWDILEQESLPTYIVNLGDSHGPSGTKRRALAMALSPAFNAGGSGASAAANATTASTSSLASSANRNASLTVGYSNGDMEVYFLNEELVEQMVDETEQFDGWIESQFAKTK
ncbi:UNVERIFIED_CONTAM: hypothetical protein HDU68_009284 [Siphonaria sp. JEL0065]|nr:hypothetical protein HDU68_009284 [Siphonaria sp. JEL0065]